MLVIVVEKLMVKLREEFEEALLILSKNLLIIKPWVLSQKGWIYFYACTVKLFASDSNLLVVVT